jgi:hypothetical protein
MVTERQGTRLCRRRTDVMPSAPTERSVGNRGRRMDRHLSQSRRCALALLALVGLVSMACGAASSSLIVAIPTTSTTATTTPAFKVLSSDGSEFGFMTDANNTAANYAVMGDPYDSTAILQDPTWLLQVAHAWGQTILGQPVSGVDHNHPIGVRYVNGQWAICNEDQAPMPAGVKFVVKLAHPGYDAHGHFAILQTATAANTQGDYTLIDDAHTNGIPTCGCSSHKT